MKIDRLQIKLIIGLIFVAIMYAVVVFIEPKEDNDEIITNKSISNDISYMKYYGNNVENINNIDMQSIKTEEIEHVAKEELFLIIEKGLSSSDYVELFMYSSQFLQNNQLANVFYEGNYCDVIDYINLNQYKGTGVEFITLRNTENYIWGYFFENDKQNEKTYIIVDKLSGKLQCLNNDVMQVIIY